MFDGARGSKRLVSFFGQVPLYPKGIVTLPSNVWEKLIDPTETDHVS